MGSGAGFAMVFALLIAAIIWNLGTWCLGLPASSSQTLIGSIIGVGVANALMGTVPIAYALNRAMPVSQTVPVVAMATTTQQSLDRYTHGASPGDPRGTLSTYIRTRAWSDDVIPAISALTGSIAEQIKSSGSLAQVPAENVTNVRNDMYLTSEAVRVFDKDAHHAALDADARANLDAFKKQIDAATKFIPLWVKVAVAIALGLGTMVGWKRIVVTIGEKIGKTQPTRRAPRRRS